MVGRVWRTERCDPGGGGDRAATVRRLLERRNNVRVGAQLEAPAGHAVSGTLALDTVVSISRVLALAKARRAGPGNCREGQIMRS